MKQFNKHLEQSIFFIILIIHCITHMSRQIVQQFKHAATILKLLHQKIIVGLQVLHQYGQWIPNKLKDNATFISQFQSWQRYQKLNLLSSHNWQSQEPKTIQISQCLGSSKMNNSSLIHFQMITLIKTLRMEFIQ